MQGQDRYDRLRQADEPAKGGHYYEDLRRTQHNVDDAQRVNAAARAAEVQQNRLYEPKYNSPGETYEARYAALSEILKERVEAGKINASEAGHAMFSFESDGSLKYRNEVIARMWHHRDLREIRDIAAEVRGHEQAERFKAPEMER